MSLSGSRLLRRIFSPHHCRPLSSVPVKRTAPGLPSVTLHPVSLATQKRVFEYAKTNRLEDAYEILHTMYHFHQTPDVRLYNSLIKAHAKNFRSPDHQDKANDLLRDMIHRGVQPNTQTYMQLLLGEVNAARSDRPSPQFLAWFDSLLEVESQRKDRQHRTPHKIKNLIRYMATARHGAIPNVMLSAVQANIRLDADVWCMALEGCSAAGRLNACEQLLAQSQCPRHLATETFAALIRAYLHIKNFDQATLLFKRMLDQGVVANQAVYTSFLFAYSTDTNDHSDILRRLWAAMLESMSPDASPSEGLLLSLLVHFARHGAFPYAERMYWDLRHRAHGLTPRLLAYMQKIILGFAHRHELISAMSLFYDLLAQKHWPSDQLVMAILELCGEHDDFQAAHQVLDILDGLREQHGVKEINGDWLAALAWQYARIGDLQHASDLYNLLLERNTPPPPRATEAMVRAYFQAGEPERAEALWQQHHPIGMPKDCLVEGYARLGLLDKAEACANPATPRTHRILIQARLELDDMPGAQRQLETALQHYAPTEVIAGIQAVLMAHALDGRVKECEHWFQVLSEAQIFMPRMYQALLLCYKQAMDTDKIPLVYENMRQRGFELEPGVYKALQPWLPM